MAKINIQIVVFLQVLIASMNLCSPSYKSPNSTLKSWSEPQTERVELLAVKTKKWDQGQEKQQQQQQEQQQQQQQQQQNLYPPDDPSPTNEDYFASYDADYVNPPGNFSALIYDTNQDNAAIFPNPDGIGEYDAEKMANEPKQSPATVDVLPEVELPDDSLADSDLRERNLIDSVQYVYFGRTVPNSGGGSRFGRWRCAIPGGALVGVIALGMTAVALLKHKTFRNSKMFPIEMNIISCFMVTDVLLIVGIGDTSSDIRCEITALLLHYLHLVCASWIFVYCYVISDNITKGDIPNLRYNYLFAYGVPAVLVMFFYAISLESYEIKDYCWMSLEKGMLLGFMLPGTVLILINTVCAMIGLKAVSKKQQEAIANTIENYITQTIMSDGANQPPPADRYISTNSSLMSLDQDEQDGGGSWMSSHPQSYRDVENSVIRNGMSFKIDLSSLSIDNLSWKTAEPEDMSDMRKCLNFALIMQPLFCVFWFMGVVALENSDQILPPFVFAFLWSHMHWFIFARFAYIHPFIPYEDCCTDIEEVNHSLHETNLLVQGQSTKSTDTIPLLVTKTELPRDSRDSNRPPDSISTISN